MKSFKLALLILLSTVIAAASAVASDYKCTIMRSAGMKKERTNVVLKAVEGQRSLKINGKLADGTYFTIESADFSVDQSSVALRKHILFTVWFSQSVIIPNSSDHDEIVAGSLPKGSAFAYFAGAGGPVYVDLTCERIR